MQCINAILVFINVVISYAGGADPGVLHGRYTRDVELYDLLVPRKLTHEGKFLTFSIPHYFSGHGSDRAKREGDDGGGVHYGISLGGKEHHLELYPNRVLIAPDAVVERRDPTVKVQDMKLEKLGGKRHCIYTGRVKGMDNSAVALSTCDGLAGYVKMKNKRFFIEPLSEHIPNKRGQHLHMVYENSKTHESSGARHCGTKDWTEAWKMRFRDKLMSGDQPKNENKRAMDSAHRYIETLVVADKKFLSHHKDTDYELYIMTIMNMVSDFYHDASAGNQMDIVVVRLMFLEKEEEEIDLEISPDADKTLASFCKWQQTVNPKDIKNPNHHDIAVLLTRYDICTNSSGCGLLGLAYMTSACTTDKPCGINEDNGLLLGVVVAHEMGHIMGCEHDEPKDSGCEAQLEDKSYHVMSPFVHLNTSIWSTCSKTYMTSMFDEDLGECLNDEPDTSLFENSNMLPGSVYDAKYQCKTNFPNSTVCDSSADETFCQQLACRISPTSCMTMGEPPADGTKCGENKWCYKTKCVEIGERPEAVNGGWGEYGQFSACSRSCGAGVSAAERDCNNPRPQHGGRYCLGDRRKVKICNTHPCPEGSPSFRSVQCSEYDSKPFQDKLYKWKPFDREADSCVLYCVNSENIYAKLAPRAKDGTKCKRGTKNMCISGSCRVIGCDYVVDSDAKEDDCGVCKGDSTECKLVDKTYTSPAGHNYVKVAVIFRGCRNIEISELKASDNTIAITGPDEKHYYLNGNFNENADGVFEMGGVEGLYSHPEPNKELLVIHGPLKENIVLFVVFYTPENVGYRYKYAEPTSKSNYQPSYHWEFVEWEECTAKCGGGVALSQPKCIEEKHGLVSASFCQASDKPQPKTRKCNEQECRTKWRVGKWGKCMACKNVSGVRVREVECVKESSKPGEEDVLVEDVVCTEKKPGTKELCNAQSSCTPTKRQALQLPMNMMKKVWLQTVANEPNADPEILGHILESKNRFKTIRELKSLHSKRQTGQNECPGGAGSAGGAGGGGGSEGGQSDGKKAKLKVGTIVQDKVNADELKLTAIPLKQSHKSINLTDEAYETMGDQIADTLDTAQSKVYKGAEAAKMLQLIQHSNCSMVETN